MTWFARCRCGWKSERYPGDNGDLRAAMAYFDHCDTTVHANAGGSKALYGELVLSQPHRRQIVSKL